MGRKEKPNRIHWYTLYELKEDNENLDVMWTCHKTPPKIITEKFDYKEYENIGLEWGDMIKF